MEIIDLIEELKIVKSSGWTTFAENLTIITPIVETESILAVSSFAKGFEVILARFDTWVLTLLLPLDV
jgi:hypothetical protein